MAGLSPFILTRSDRRELIGRALESALAICAAPRGFILIAGPAPEAPGDAPFDPPAEALRRPGRGLFVSSDRDMEGLDPEAFPGSLTLASEALSSRSSRREGRRLAVPMVLSCSQAGGDMESQTRQPPAVLEEVLGVLYVERSEGSPSFDEATMRTVTTLASWVAALDASTRVSIAAQTDGLTGLLNRGAFFRRLQEEVRLAASDGQPMSLLMLDLRHLDLVNRRAGRGAGDRVLALAGRMLQERIRWRDFAARLGGDELIAALPGAGGEVASSIAARLREAFGRELDGAGLPPPAINGGIACFPEHAADPGRLLRLADQALTAAKKLGPGRILTWCADYAGVRERTDRLEGLLMGNPSEDYERVLTLLDTISDVNSDLESRRLLARLLDRMIEATNAARAVLLEPAPGGEMRFALARDRSGADLPASAVPTCRQTVERALLTGTPSFSAPATGGAGRPAGANAEGTALAVPLATPDGIVGLAYLESRDAPSRYTASTLAFLNALGHEVALVLERNRLIGDLERKREKIEALNRRLRARVEDQDRQIVAIQGELERTQARIAGRAEPLFAASGPMREILEMITSAARTESPVLITGETGVGKEVLAREVHRLSRRAAGPFIAVNCAAIPDTLIESELFGHAKGAFTGAERERAGLFEQARGGTLFLDEIASTDTAFQAKLLRALQEGAVRRVGETLDRKADVRVVAAANVDLETAIARRRFREDLYYRLAVFTVRVPPLRNRPADVPVLARAFMREACELAGIPDPGLDQESLALLARQPWRGNVRELRNVIERLAATAPAGPVGVADVLMALGAAAGGEGDPSWRPDGPAGSVGGSGAGREEARARTLLEEMRATGGSFWEVVRARYLERELTREDLRRLLALGLACCGGSYKKTAALFNIEPGDHKRFLDFIHNNDLRTKRRRARHTVPA